MGIKRRQYWGLIFVLPAVIFFALFSYLPMINSFIASFHSKDIISLKAPVFVGFKNYIHIFTSEDFINSIKATIIFAVGCFIPLVTISLLIATVIVSLRRIPWIQNLFKMIYYSPSIVSGVVSATIWLLIFDPRGLANQWLNFIAGNPTPVDFKWLALPAMARLATIIIYFWKYVGYFVIIYFAGLVSIPQSLYEVADIDGASGWKKFLSITIPLLKPTIEFVFIVAFIQCVRTFSIQYVFVQSGSPREPINVVSLNIYTTAMQYHSLGRSTAMSVSLFCFILIFTIVQLRIYRSERVSYV
ncbi:MAG: sugar ABC transporter permease [Spirochaetes bacterium]|nr:MAG: sugar ABC transporter permease [Spirochaetota bacterium]